MDSQDLKPECWYWIRRDDGTVAPYRFHRMGKRGFGQFYVGSLLQDWPLSRVVGEAQMPRS